MAGGYVLDEQTTITCPHGGNVTIKPRAAKVKVDKRAPFVLDDFNVTQPTISGCGLNISGSPSPCLHIHWQLAATRVKVDKSPVLLSTSVGLCMNAASVPQGKALVSGWQQRVKAS